MYVDLYHNNGMLTQQKQSLQQIVPTCSIHKETGQGKAKAIPIIQYIYILHSKCECEL